MYLTAQSSAKLWVWIGDSSKQVNTRAWHAWHGWLTLQQQCTGRWAGLV
jgi:hypothetical protein